jgi:alginate O-acetyltransferase complex protein AlgI
VVFSSHLFVYYFLPLTLLVYYALPRRGRHAWLLLMSYLFYGWANPAFMGLMLVSTAIDYIGGRRIGALPPEAKRARRAWLILSMASNLSLLGFFKYFNFSLDSANSFLEAVGLGHLQLEVALRVALPLGISFYTFQSMSYCIDIYRGQARPLASFLDFALFVSLFPQLVAGPIIRFTELADQLNERTHTFEKFSRGVAFMSLGLAKKILLANPCGFVADAAFNAAFLNVLDAWTGAVAYAFQIYFDFSGYSDMAIGLGLMFGFVFPKNFDSPYRADSITDFWRRWHISLSTWLRDYLYRPLGGNRKGPWRTYVNLAIVMLLGGLWHGAAWNFVVWGGLHGLWLAAERAMGKRSLYGPLPRPARVALTFFGVLITWVFFRAADLPAAVHYLASMFCLADVQPTAELIGAILYTPYSLLSLGIAALVIWLAPQTWDWTRRLTPAKAGLSFSCLLLALIAMGSQGFNPFIYFNF